MLRALRILPSFLALGSAPGPLPSATDHLNSRSVILTFQTEKPARIDNTRVWASSDGGNTWTTTAVASASPNSVCVDVPNDGKYGFYIVLENDGGPSAPVPTAGTAPLITVNIDTAPPTIQIHEARQANTPDGDRELLLRTSLIEENLGPAGVRVFFRTGPDPAWVDGGPVGITDGAGRWRPPPNTPPEIDLRLLVTDLAGNSAFDEVRGVSIGDALLETPASVSPQVAFPATAGPDGTENVTVQLVPPVTVAPVPPVTLADQPEPTRAAAPSPPASNQTKRLRELAARYSAEGRLSLAGARLQDALELAPDDPDLQVDLGSVLYRTRQYDQATDRYRSALEASPDHLGAIEGLALVEATQNRYSDARSHLQHLLRLNPQPSKHWLHYGDVEHMLGNTAAARTAWEKVLEIEPADDGLRAKAQKRLELFAPKRPDSQ